MPETEGMQDAGPEVNDIAAEAVTETYVQRFTMAVEYLVLFTANLFDPDNPALADVVSLYEPDKRHRVFVVLDGGVAKAWPDLNERLTAYAARHGDRLEFLAVDIVAGGEAVKNQLHVPIFLDDLDGFATTQPAVSRFLAQQRRNPVTQHLEVETYTWDVLPKAHRRDDVVTNIVKEMRWARRQLGAA